MQTQALARGETAKAYVVLLPGAEADADGILAHCREHLAAYKVPRSVQFVPDLPRTSTGRWLCQPNRAEATARWQDAVAVS